MVAGLRDLVEFLPASLAAIISYFSAEITRGVWKSVLMNGIDWPSPAAILPSVQSEIKEILAATGVSIPNYPSGTCFLFFSLLVPWFSSLLLQSYKGGVISDNSVGKGYRRIMYLLCIGN